MIVLRMGMLYHKDTNTLVGVWPNSTNMFDAPPHAIVVRGKQKELAFNLTTHVGRRYTGDLCTVYEHRNDPDYYMLKMYYSRQAMEEWWNEARGRIPA